MVSIISVLKRSEIETDSVILSITAVMLIYEFKITFVCSKRTLKHFKYNLGQNSEIMQRTFS